MADSTETNAAGEERRLLCRYCPDLGADVCIADTPSASGSGHAIYAHRSCAEARHIPVLYALVPQQATGATS